MKGPGEADAASHPYYPVNAALPHYAANETPLVKLLVTFAATIASVVVVTVVAARRTHTKMAFLDQLSVAWFALCGRLQSASPSDVG